MDPVRLQRLLDAALCLRLYKGGQPQDQMRHVAPMMPSWQLNFLSKCSRRSSASFNANDDRPGGKGSC